MSAKPLNIRTASLFSVRVIYGVTPHHLDGLEVFSSTTAVVCLVRLSSMIVTSQHRFICITPTHFSLHITRIISIPDSVATLPLGSRPLAATETGPLVITGSLS